MGTPDQDNLYQDQISITVTDGMGIASQPANFTLDIVAVNDPPVIIDYVSNTVLDEDSELTLNLNGLYVNDPDNTWPGDFYADGLTVLEGEHYTTDNATIIPERKGEAKETLADISKIKKHLNWVPSIKLEKWLKENMLV